MRMVRSSGERTRDVKRRYARRGGSIPPRAEQQEKSIFCNKHPRLKRYRPQKGGHRAGKFTLAARKDEQKTNNNRLKRFGQRTFFLTAGKTANKKTFHKRPAVGLKRRHSWQAWKASRGCNTPLFVKVSSFPSVLTRLTRSTLPTRPVRFRGLPQFYNQKGEPHARLLKNFSGV